MWIGHDHIVECKLACPRQGFYKEQQGEYNWEKGRLRLHKEIVSKIVSIFDDKQ